MLSKKGRIYFTKMYDADVRNWELIYQHYLIAESCIIKCDKLFSGNSRSDTITIIVSIFIYSMILNSRKS